jgi:hypothetical protein
MRDLRYASRVLVKSPNHRGVTAGDPVTFATTAATVLGVAAIAALVPALRIARLNPIRALRS